jgi:hypothetical protein
MNKSEKKQAGRAVVPPDIVVLMGKRPLLVGEGETTYDELLSRIAVRVDPQDIMEWFYVKDVADYTWEIFRLRRILAAILNNERKHALAELFATINDKGEPERLSLQETGMKQAEAYFSGDRKAKDKLHDGLIRYGFNEDALAAAAFGRKVQLVEAVDRLLAAAESRRSKLLREIDINRKALGLRVRTMVEHEDDRLTITAGPQDGEAAADAAGLVGASE